MMALTTALRLVVKQEVKLRLIKHCPVCGTPHDATALEVCADFERTGQGKLFCGNCYERGELVVVWPTADE